MTFHRFLLSSPAACVALHRGRRKLRACVAALRSVPDAAFADEFASMVAAVEAGFRHEETLLERLGDACLHPRFADHAVILSALHRTMARVENGDIARGRQVAHALGHALELPWPLIPSVSVACHTAAATQLRHAGRRA